MMSFMFSFPNLYASSAVRFLNKAAMIVKVGLRLHARALSYLTVTKLAKAIRPT